MHFIALPAASSTYIPPNTASPQEGTTQMATVPSRKSTAAKGVRNFLLLPSAEKVSARNTSRKIPRIISSGNIAPN